MAQCLNIDIKHFILLSNHFSDLVSNSICVDCGYRKVWFSYQISHSNTITFHISVLSGSSGFVENILNFIDKSMNMNVCQSRIQQLDICWLAWFLLCVFFSVFFFLFPRNKDHLSRWRSLNSWMHVGCLGVGILLWTNYQIYAFFQWTRFRVCCRRIVKKDLKNE